MRDVSNTSLAVSCKHYLKTGNRSLRTIWHFIGTFELLNISQLDTLAILNRLKSFTVPAIVGPMATAYLSVK